ncbi:MAG: DNA repair protein RadA, partial [Sphingobacteriaceae bacterium]
MAKTKSAYFCQSCGFETPKWLGKCPACGQWNTFVEEVIEKANMAVPEWKPATSSLQRSNKPVPVSEIVYSEEDRLITPDKELNR